MTRFVKASAALAAALLLGWPVPAAASAQNACGDLGGTVDADVCRIHTTTNTYTFDAAFPTTYPDAGPMIDYLRQTRDGFVNVSQMPGSRNLPYELDIKETEYRSGPAQRGTRSVVFEIFQDVGGAHPSTWYKAFNYSLETGQPITYDSLFPPGSQPLPLIFPVVQAELERTTGLENSFIPGAGLDPANYQDFAITDNELIFFFGQGELLPSAAGALVAHVPKATVSPILSYPGLKP